MGLLSRSVFFLVFSTTHVIFSQVFNFNVSSIAIGNKDIRSKILPS